ncbi:hypothetical protein B0H10DRAFT_1625683, partial [Mycena sp. CBHHK59/15]
TKRCLMFNADLLVPRLGPIYRALDELEYYPIGWADIVSLVLRKLGKPYYTDPSAHRPVVLTKSFPRIYHTAKTRQVVVEAERAGILPDSHFGG